jgi:hypothetical protein
MSNSSAQKVVSFARMMVLAQRRHEERMAVQAAPEPDVAQRRENAMRRTLQKMSGTKRLVVFMYPA